MLPLKFGNIAGLAFWSMLAVTFFRLCRPLSHAQIPRNLKNAALTMKEMTDISDSMPYSS